MFIYENFTTKYRQKTLQQYYAIFSKIRLFIEILFFKSNIFIV